MKRIVQHGAVDTPMSSLSSEASVFYCTFETVSQLITQLRACELMPEEGDIFYWAGDYWRDLLALTSLDRLPSQDPLRLKLVRPEG